MAADRVIDMAAVKNFIAGELLYGDDQGLDYETNLIDSGVIDSMSLLRLISFLEEHFHIATIRRVRPRFVDALRCFS